MPSFLFVELGDAREELLSSNGKEAVDSMQLHLMRDIASCLRLITLS